jgi:REP element-mobilizing transposase RayT
MQRDKIVFFMHLVWTTWDRLPLIAPEKERALHDCIASVAHEQGCRVIAIYGMPDHVHLLLSMSSTVTLGFLIQQLKGISSHFANHNLDFGGEFKWCGSYAAFSVSR